MESPWPGLVLKPSRQPRSLASHGGRGSWVITACFPRPQLGRDRVKRLPSAFFHGSTNHEAELRQVLSPPPCGLGMAARPGVSGRPLQPARWGDARFQSLAPRGRVEVSAPAARPSGVAVRWRLRGQRARCTHHLPTYTPRPSRGHGCGKEQPSSYCSNH